MTNSATFSRMDGNYRSINRGRSSESGLAHRNLIGDLLPVTMVIESGAEVINENSRQIFYHCVQPINSR